MKKGKLIVTLAPWCEKQGLLIVKEYGAGQYNIERKASNQS